MYKKKNNDQFILSKKRLLDYSNQFCNSIAKSNNRVRAGYFYEKPHQERSDYRVDPDNEITDDHRELERYYSYNKTFSLYDTESLSSVDYITNILINSFLNIFIDVGNLLNIRIYLDVLNKNLSGSNLELKCFRNVEFPLKYDDNTIYNIEHDLLIENKFVDKNIVINIIDKNTDDSQSIYRLIETKKKNILDNNLNYIFFMINRTYDYNTHIKIASNMFKVKNHWTYYYSVNPLLKNKLDNEHMIKELKAILKKITSNSEVTLKYNKEIFVNILCHMLKDTQSVNKNVEIPIKDTDDSVVGFHKSDILLNEQIIINVDILRHGEKNKNYDILLGHKDYDTLLIVFYNNKYNVLSSKILKIN